MPETSLAAEVMPIEKWLELEFGVTPIFCDHAAGRGDRRSR